MSLRNLLKKFIALESHQIQAFSVFFLGGFIAFFLLILGIFLGSLIQTHLFPSPNIPLSPSQPQASSTPQKDSLISLEGNRFLLKKENLFLVGKVDREGHLEILNIYRLSQEKSRFPKDPGKLALHGYYFDDITIPQQNLLKEKCQKFQELGKKPLYLLKFSQEAKELSEEIADLGGISFLLGQLSLQNSPRLRRAASLSLGKRGYLQAIPILMEFIEEKDLSQRKDIFEILQKNTDLPFSESAPLEEIKKTVNRWWEERKEVK